VEFSIKTGAPEKLKTGCAVVGVFESRKLTAPADALDKASKGHIANLLKRGDLDGKAGSTLLLHQVPGVAAERVLLVGLGKAEEYTAKAYRDAMAAALGALKKTAAKDALVTLAEVDVKDCDVRWRLRQAAMIAEEAAYRFDHLKSKKDDNNLPPERLAFTAPAQEAAQAETGLRQGRAIALGMNLTRDLGNLPGNICTPSYLADQARQLAKQYKLKCQVLERAQMEKLGMGALLSVARGSHQPPKFIVLEYRGGKAKEAPVVLVGKGITFDTGGISIKPAPEMDEMKYDMCGAASVLGTFKACAEMKLPLNLVGLVPTTENMPGGAASRPGDIVTSLSGQTVEILNTDAEGRLILCDALTYAERFNPDCVVDIATLTGACVIALGHVATGLLANNDELAGELLECGRRAYDRAWQLPLWEDYQEQLKSPFADMANIGGRPAGTITAACFLARFTKKYVWAHLDIAGTAWRSGKDKGATGRPVPLLTHFLLKRAGRL
jgi:leucyl aminopeptidase